jgi:tetratricopeptide (TPR) repeat protein
MFKMKKIIYILSLIGSIAIAPVINASEDTISQWTYNYFKRIHNYMEMERFEDAGRELETLANRYFKNERSYERALINQLYGQFYMIQGDFYSAIPWFEKAVQFGYLNLPGEIQTRSNLAAAYFQAGRYDDVIKTLLMTQEMGMKRGIDLSASNFVMLGMSYYQLNDIQPAYKYISKGNDVSEKLNEDWLQYEFGLAVKLKKYNEAIEVGQFLIFVNPDKSTYWKQLSGVYYGGNNEDQSLAGLELAFEKGAMEKEVDFLNLSKYFLYKDLPTKAIKVLNFGFENKKIKIDKKNLDLLADAYFLSKDREEGINTLIKSLDIEADSKTSYKIARFAFEAENWDMAIKYFNRAKSEKWNDVPGRIDLLTGIAYFEKDQFNDALKYMEIAINYDESKSAAEGWIQYIKQSMGA